MAAKAAWRRGAPFLLFAVAAAVFAADQLSKNWVVANLTEGETVAVLGDFLQWHFVRNPGAAFSFATGMTWVFTLLAVAVTAAILWQIRRLRSITWALFLGTLLGGVLGNLFDRLTREPGFPEGHVIDFILTPWMWLGFPPAIYNIADIAIVVSMVVFVLVTVLGVHIDGSPRGDHDKELHQSEAVESGGAAQSVADAGLSDSEAGGDAAP